MPPDWAIAAAAFSLGVLIGLWLAPSKEAVLAARIDGFIAGMRVHRQKAIAKEGGDPRYEELLKLAEGMAEAAEYLRRNLCDGDDADLDDDGDEIEPFDRLSAAVVAFRLQHQKDTEHG